MEPAKDLHAHDLSDELVFTWPVCHCHGVEDGHRRLVARMGPNTLLDVCQNGLWCQSVVREPGAAGPRTYRWEFSIPEPSAEWKAAMDALDDRPEPAASHGASSPGG